MQVFCSLTEANSPLRLLPHPILSINYSHPVVTRTQAVCKRWQFISSDKSLWDEVKISGAKGNAWLTKRCLMRLESPLKHATCLKLGNVPIRNEHILVSCLIHNSNYYFCINNNGKKCSKIV